MKKILSLLAVATTLLITANITFAGSTQVTQPAKIYTPGLGDIMGAIQPRHAKLWFAGEAQNWPLASYELDEITEAFNEAVEFQPNFKGKPIAVMIKEMTNKPFTHLKSAIETKNKALFTKAFDELTHACNVCHRANGYEFIVIKRPTIVPTSNQIFVPIK